MELQELQRQRWMWRTDETESFAGLVLASGAGHVVSPLAFCGETSQNRFSRSEAWVTPRFGLAPPTALTADGALNYGLTCGGGLIATIGLLSIPPLSVSAALSGLYLRPKSFLASQPATDVGDKSIPLALSCPLIFHRPRTYFRRNLSNFSRFFQSPNYRVHGCQEIPLLGHSEMFHSIPHFRRKKRSFCRPEHRAASISDPRDKTNGRPRIFLQFGKLLQRGNHSFLFRDSCCKFVLLDKHQLEFVSRLLDFRFAAVNHRQEY